MTKQSRVVQTDMIYLTRMNRERKYYKGFRITQNYLKQFS